MTGLSDRMRALADTGHSMAADLRMNADELDAAVGLGDPKAILGAWARARLLWCECTDEDLV